MLTLIFFDTFNSAFEAIFFGYCNIDLAVSTFTELFANSVVIIDAIHPFERLNDIIINQIRAACLLLWLGRP